MDKIEEIKKLLWILDSKHNVSIPQTKENIDYIADEIVKLFAIPDVVRSLPEHELWTELSDNFREMAHRYKDGEFDYRTIWDWFQQQQKVYRLERQ